MEAVVYTIIALNEISSATPYCLRYSLQDSRLESSMMKRGILVPVTVVSSEAQKTLIAGHKRIETAKALGLKQIPAIEIQGTHSPKDLFLFALVSNWNQDLPDLDRAWILEKAKGHYGFSDSELIEELLPALGLPGQKPVLDQYLQVAKLEKGLLNLIAEEKLPFRGVQVLARFSLQDQQTFASLIAANTALTTNDLLKVGDWLHDLLKIDGSILQEWIKNKRLDEILEHSQWDKRIKTEKLINALRELRFPHLIDCEKRFGAVAQEISASAKDLKLEAPAAFEDRGFLLHAKVRDPKSLEHILTLLNHKRNLLNSLFDIML